VTGVTKGVSICGLGAVTGYGWGQKLLREGMVSGESAVRLSPGFGTHFDTEEVWVALIEDGGDPADGKSLYARAARHAVREAFGDAYDRGWRPGEVVGLINGVVLGDVGAWRGFHRRHGYHTNKKDWLNLMPSTLLSNIMQEFDMHGPNMMVTAMCASGVAGLLTAKMWIDAGLATDVLVLATDLSGSPENIRAFSDLGVLIVDSPPFESCKPFQQGSRGFVGGEAAVAMIVSGRPSGSYATIRGGAMTHDGFHAISINPDHKQVFRAFRTALDNSGVDASEIAYVNAHGPGTKQCDTCEEASGRPLPGRRGLGRDDGDSPPFRDRVDTRAATGVGRPPATLGRFDLRRSGACPQVVARDGWVQRRDHPGATCLRLGLTPAD
jgi:3-oxoacyl-[acyl-carrier-protein] synthase II